MLISVHFPLLLGAIGTKAFSLSLGGFVAGMMAGFLGIGGGILLVPLLVGLNTPPVQAVGTSTLAILMTATSGSLQNLRMGHVRLQRVVLLGLPAILTAQLGAYLANLIMPAVLLMAFGGLLLVTIHLVEIRKQIAIRPYTHPHRTMSPFLARVATGGTTGLMAGLFGVGGGVILVPLQMLLLREPIKVAIQTSLGVIVITALSALLGHALAGNVLLVDGLLVGIGGLIGAQISSRFLPKLPDRFISMIFRALLGLLAVYVFWQAWHLYI